MSVELTDLPINGEAQAAIWQHVAIKSDSQAPLDLIRDGAFLEYIWEMLIGLAVCLCVF